ARTWPLPDAEIGECIRYVVAHEVGHALGLNHNMKASAMYPPDKARDKAWVDEMGYSPSIEDYSRFNYVAQPEDGLPPEDLVPRIGPYDCWAIHWGYATISGARTPEDEKSTLDKWAREQEKTPWFRWVTENGEPADPADRMESVGDADPIGSTALGLKNLHRVMDMLAPATANQNWRDLEYLYKRVLGQWTNEMLTVAGWVGGMEGQEFVKVGDGARFSVVRRERQKAAVIFLNENAFTTPRFLIRPDILRRIEPSGEADHILEAQSWVLRKLLDTSRLNRMVEQEAIDGALAYSVPELLSDLRKGVWSELYSNARVDMWRRNLQRSYLEIMKARMYSTEGAAYREFVRADLVELQTGIASALTRPAIDRDTRAHFEQMNFDIGRILDPKSPITPIKEPEAPSYFPLR
ncbi:MAG: zinc-dependent metalloprotease, partial [Bryobacteraceae bacterium]